MITKDFLQHRFEFELLKPKRQDYLDIKSYLRNLILFNYLKAIYNNPKIYLKEVEKTK